MPGKSDLQLAAWLVYSKTASEESIRDCLELLERTEASGAPLHLDDLIRMRNLVSPEVLDAARLEVLLDSDDPARSRLVEGYELESKVGSGLTSRVFKARKLPAGPIVALKILHPRMASNPQRLRAFREEAELLMPLKHENIVQGLALGRSHGLEYFAMEFVDGETLLGYIQRKMVFNEDAALYVILQIARALEYLNREGVVHRDIKPGNILLTLDNTVKLCDLGFAARAGGPEGEAETTVGTVQYISPEQARGRTDIDIRADIYSLGVTLYHMVVGELPFHGSDDSEILTKQILESLSSEELKGKGISDHLHYFIQKMMAKDRDIRYGDPSALISDVSEHIRGKKTLTYNPMASGAPDFLDKPFQDKASETPSARSVRKPTGEKDAAARRRETELRERIRRLKKKHE